MKRILANRTVRGFALIALVAAVIVAFSLEPVLVTVGALLRIAFFLFLVWRERRSDIEAWSEHGRRVFYAAIVLAVVDLGAYFGLRPGGLELLAAGIVLAACIYAGWRVWRDEHRYTS